MSDQHTAYKCCDGGCGLRAECTQHGDDWLCATCAKVRRDEPSELGPQNAEPWIRDGE